MIRIRIRVNATVPEITELESIRKSETERVRIQRISMADQILISICKAIIIRILRCTEHKECPALWQICNRIDTAMLPLPNPRPYRVGNRRLKRSRRKYI